MPFFNDRLNYGILSKVLHWLVVLMLLVMFASGAIHANLPEDSSLIPLVLSIHKSSGVAVLLVMTVRLLLRWAQKSPDAIESVPGIFRFLAFIVHYAIYFSVLAQALAGVAMTQLAGYTAGIGPLVMPELPFLTSFFSGKEEAGEFFHWIHHINAKVLGALIGLHILGALFHRFILGDETASRMWSNRQT